MGITDPAREYFKDGLWGWISSAWKKLSILWGYSDFWLEEYPEATGTAGVNNLDFTTVPTDETWVLESLAARDRDNAPTAIEFRVREATDIAYVDVNSAPAANTWHVWTGRVTVPPGYYVNVRITGVTVNDRLNANAIGHKMKIG